MRTALFIAALLALACRFVDDDALVAAVRAGDVPATEKLLARGDDPNQPVGVNDWPPLMHAVHKQQIKTAAVLLQHGADVNRSAPDGMTPLMMAAGYGNDGMVRLLLAHRADARLKTKDGASALDFALTGVSDIDKFTLFRCQDSTARLLRRSESKTSSRMFARFKRCAAAL